MNSRRESLGKLLPPVIIVVSALLVYGRTIGFDFITTWDDNRYVYENPLIQSLSWSTLKAIFSTSILGTYGPLHLLSYSLDYLLWGLNPAGYHLQNLLLHTANGLLGYYFFLQCNLQRRVAALAAFIFVCHPVQVEVVAWVSQRKTLLCVTFILLALIGYRRAAMATAPKRYPLAPLLLFSAALLAKSLAVVLPLLLLCHDLVFRRQESPVKSLQRLIPYAVAAAVFAIVAMNTQAAAAGGGRADWYGGGPLGTLCTMLPVFVAYLRLIVWPANLSADYAVTIRSGPDVTVLLSGLLLLCCLVPLVRLFRRRDPRCFWASFIIAGLLPVSQIVPLVTLMNDRYLYLPMLGVAVLLADGGDRLARSLAARIPRPAGRLVGGLLLLPLLTLPFLAFQRAGDWKDGITLWGRDLQKYPNNHIIMTSLADSYREAGKPQIALKLYRQALAINPRYFIALNNYPNLLMETGNPKVAQGFAENLVRNYPLYGKGFETLGLSYEMTGDTAKAEQAFREALRLEPRLAESLTSLGIIEMRKGNLAEARRLLARAEEQGKTPQLSYSYACFELNAGQPDEALRRLRESVQLGFDNFAQLQGDPCMEPLLQRPEVKALMQRNNR